MNIKRLILIGAFLYCVAPDLFAGPLDDTLILLGSMLLNAGNITNKKKDPEYMKLDQDY